MAKDYIPVFWVRNNRKDSFEHLGGSFERSSRTFE
jgi:hypothetical protein